MKKAIMKLDFQDGEARLWKDEEDGVLTVSVDDPFYGFEESKDVMKLADFFKKAAEKMKKRRQ